MDKWQAKQAAGRVGVLTAEAVLLEAEKEISRKEIQRGITNVGLPCVIKPNCQGSSVGVVIAQTEDQAEQAIEQSLAHYGDCLVEQFIAGRELTVGILGEQTLPVLEVKPAHGFYDYQAKYVSDDTVYSFETGLDEEQLELVQDQARKAFDAIGCRDLGRVDFILDYQGRIYFLEVNTLPGFTSHSLVPKAAGQIGLSFEEMCEQIVRMSLRRPI
jgi:D-alanine-D-alanine ligase